MILYLSMFYPGRWTKSRRQLVLNVIYHRQNLLGIFLPGHSDVRQTEAGLQLCGELGISGMKVTASVRVLEQQR
jgi:hypothetical protein